MATIRDDDALPLLSIADVALTEGTASVPAKATFTVTLSVVSGRTVAITAATAEGTARRETIRRPGSIFCLPLAKP
jgi:hypothetical protein